MRMNDRMFYYIFSKKELEKYDIKETKENVNALIEVIPSGRTTLDSFPHPQNAPLPISSTPS